MGISIPVSDWPLTLLMGLPIRRLIHSKCKDVFCDVSFPSQCTGLWLLLNYRPYCTSHQLVQIIDPRSQKTGLDVNWWYSSEIKQLIFLLSLCEDLTICVSLCHRFALSHILTWRCTSRICGCTGVEAMQAVVVLIWSVCSVSTGPFAHRAEIKTKSKNGWCFTLSKVSSRET